MRGLYRLDNGSVSIVSVLFALFVHVHNHLEWLNICIPTTSWSGPVIYECDVDSVFIWPLGRESHKIAQAIKNGPLSHLMVLGVDTRLWNAWWLTVA